MQLLDHAYDLSYLQNGYGDFIRRWTEDEGEEFNDGHFHASNLGQCPRKAILKRSNRKGRPADEDKQAMFAEANFIHSGMTRFWMDRGTAISREIRFADGPFPGWSGKFDAIVHRPEWCGCDKETKDMQEDFSHLRLMRDLGTDWRTYSSRFIDHTLFLCSLKTVAPAGLRHYAEKPAEHHVWQDSWYAYEFAGMFDLPVPNIVIMYRSRGGCATPIWHFVKPLDVRDKVKEYDELYDRYLEEDTLPDILPLVAKRHKDKAYGEIIKLEQGWECGYCDYAGWHDGEGNFRCDPLKPTNVTGDRIGVNVGGRIHLVAEWWTKTGHKREEMYELLDKMHEDEGYDEWPAYAEVEKSEQVRFS